MAKLACQHLQDSILRLAITDDKFLGLIAGQVQPELFGSIITSTIAQLCLDYWAEYHKAPGDHFHDEIVQQVQTDNDDLREQYVTYVKRLRAMPLPNKPYIIRRLNDLIKTSAYQAAAIEFAEHVAEGRFDEAQNTMYDALRAGIEQEEIGLDYLHDFSALPHRLDGTNKLPTGIEALDNLIGGLPVPGVTVILGGYKAGKTWAQQHFALTALLAGWKVFFATHEVHQEALELRFDMMISARGSEGKWIGKTIEYPIFDSTARKVVLVKKAIESVYKNDKIVRARARVRRFGGSLRIKKWPSGDCSVAELERSLNYLETYEHWVPDVVVTDYADIMKHNTQLGDLRHQINGTYLALKGLSDRRNIPIITASQVVRAALKRKHIRMSDVAEDARKAGNCDLMLAIGRTDEDVKSHTAHISVLANRMGVQDVHCAMSMCFHIGQFCLSSWLGDTITDEMYDMFGTGK